MALRIISYKIDYCQSVLEIFNHTKSFTNTVHCVYGWWLINRKWKSVWTYTSNCATISDWCGALLNFVPRFDGSSMNQRSILTHTSCSLLRIAWMGAKEQARRDIVRDEFHLSICGKLLPSISNGTDIEYIGRKIIWASAKCCRAQSISGAKVCTSSHRTNASEVLYTEWSRNGK